MRALRLAAATLVLVGSTLVHGQTTGPATRAAVRPATRPTNRNWPPAQQQAIENWKDMRFGMFIHWGPVSIKGTEIGWSRGAQVPVEEYDNLYKQFNPTKFNADEWVATAKAAGMKYIVLTTKHHDGFCLWDTKYTDYKITNTPFKRDVLRELADACKKQGIRLGAYYSVCDWHRPDFPLTSPGGKTVRESYDLDRYQQYLLNQERELVENYGPLVELWNDVPQLFSGRGFETIKLVRGLQPDILVNDRTGDGGDFGTPEQKIGNFQIARPWESCITICRQWAWKPNDQMKTLPQCLQTLITCAGGDGNLLFNVGPTPEGIIEDRQVQRLKEMGEWLAKYGDTIYGTRGGPYTPGQGVVSTRKGNSVYLHILRPTEEPLTLPLPAGVTAHKVLTGEDLKIDRTSSELTIRYAKLPAQGHIDTIVELTLATPAADLPIVKLKPDVPATTKPAKHPGEQ